MAKFIFLDLETTGLIAGIDQITEAAWITDDGAERHYFIEHTRLPNAWVLDNTDYVTRILPAKKTSLAALRAAIARDCEPDGTTYMVGACPSFDDRFLRRIDWNPPYNYHIIDIEVLVMGMLGRSQPPLLKHLRGLLGISGDNPAPHTALADAREVKLAWEIVQAYQQHGAPPIGAGVPYLPTFTATSPR